VSSTPFPYWLKYPKELEAIAIESKRQSRSTSSCEERNRRTVSEQPLLHRADVVVNAGPKQQAVETPEIHRTDTAAAIRQLADI
jgi:hypothetical protein